jgi:uncharacterized protein HemX
MDNPRRRKFQFSIGTLLVLTAVVAVLLVPLAWVARQRQQMMLAQREILAAREVALRSVVHEADARRQIAASGPTQPKRSEEADMKNLRRENAELKHEVEELRRKLEKLRNPPQAK